MFMPHYMSDDMFLLLTVLGIGLMVLTVLLAALLVRENHRADHSTKLLREARLRAFELDPNELEKSNRLLRSELADKSYLVRYLQMLVQNYADYATTLETAKAVASATNPANVQLVDVSTGLPLRKPDPDINPGTDKVAEFYAGSEKPAFQPIGLGS